MRLNRYLSFGLGSGAFGGREPKVESDSFTTRTVLFGRLGGGGGGDDGFGDIRFRF